MKLFKYIFNILAETFETKFILIMRHDLGRNFKIEKRNTNGRRLGQICGKCSVLIEIEITLIYSQRRNPTRDEINFCLRRYGIVIGTMYFKLIHV